MDYELKHLKSPKTIGIHLISARIKVCFIALSVILFAVSLSYFVFEPNTLKWLAQEDGWVENLSALNWLLAAAMMFFLFAKKRNVWFLLLGIFFTICLGEEISWGQRLFGFATPSSISASNFQGEFNLHNLNIFERRAGASNFWRTMHDLGRLFAIFCFFYGILLPAGIKLSGRLRQFIQRIHLPVMPLTVGIFFLINYTVFQYFEDVHQVICLHLGIINNANCSSLPVEIREWYESLLFLVFTLLLFTESRAAVVAVPLKMPDKAAVVPSRKIQYPSTVHYRSTTKKSIGQKG